MQGGWSTLVIVGDDRIGVCTIHIHHSAPILPLRQLMDPDLQQTRDIAAYINKTNLTSVNSETFGLDALSESALMVFEVYH